MVERANRQVRRRPLRRPICLVALGLLSSLGAAFAVAATTMSPNRNSRSPLSIRATPTHRTVMAGSSADFSLRLGRSHRGAISLSGQTDLSIAGPLPTGAAASFSPRSTAPSQQASRRMTSLSVSTGAETPPGTYLLRVRAHRPHRDGATTVRLTVSAPAGVAPEAAEAAPPENTVPDAFTISGELPGVLTPGTTTPLDLTLTNREAADISITGLSVELGAVQASRSDAAHPCDAGDFAIEQFSGGTFSLAASSTASLGELGFSAAQLPTVSMLDLPLNQDGCKQASLTFAYTGTATEAP
jgi:hypothetical protein